MNRRNPSFEHNANMNIDTRPTGPGRKAPCLCHLMNRLHPEDRERVLTAPMSNLNRRGAFEIEFRLMGESGWRWVLSQGWLTERGGGPPVYRKAGTVSQAGGRDAQADLADISEAKSRQLRYLAHEARNLVNGMMGLARLLREDPALCREHKDLIDGIGNAGESLLHVLNDTLELSRVEMGRLPLATCPLDPGEIVDRVRQILEPAARAKGLPLRAHREPKVPDDLLGDPYRLEQILINLVANAIKFTERGHVDIAILPVEIARERTVIRFQVGDTGTGIAPEDLSGLFQPFHQARDGIRQGPGSSGLGLAISRGLVELMGGRIGVSSESGRGSVFWFEIPFSRAGG